MSKYKTVITDTGDAGLGLSWVREPATITGYGYSVLEQNVPIPCDEFDVIMVLTQARFPKGKIVIRIDKIIPTQNGIETVKSAFKMFMDGHPICCESGTDCLLCVPYGKARYKREISAMIYSASCM